MNLHTVAIQTRKELAQFRRDKLTVALAFVLPMLALLMYGFAIRLESKDINVAVTNLDIGKTSRDLIASIFASIQLTPGGTTNGDILQPLDYGRAKATIYIPPDFSKNLAAGRPATYQAIIDATDVNNARVIKNALLATTNAFANQAGLQKQADLIQPQTRLWFNPGRKEALHITPGGMALVLWIFPALLSTLALVREKEQGTILQVYASNLTAMELVAGKAIAYTLVGIVEVLILIATMITVFDVGFRTVPLLFVVDTVLYIMSGVLFGLFGATRATTQMAAVQIVANMGFLAAMLFSGFIYPIRNIVFPLSLISYVVPAYYYILDCRNVFVRGGSSLALWYVPVFLLAFDLVFLRICSRMQMKLKG